MHYVAMTYGKLAVIITLAILTIVAIDWKHIKKFRIVIGIVNFFVERDSHQHEDTPDEKSDIKKELPPNDDNK